jgi:hypothetical protein
MDFHPLSDIFRPAGRKISDKKDKVPLRIAVFSSIPGVDFATCYARRIETVIAGVQVPMIDLADLKQNKLASGRPKDMNDLQNLP